MTLKTRDTADDSIRLRKKITALETKQQTEDIKKKVYLLQQELNRLVR